ncbi:uncharacterized protein TM35_000013090 [Trypanosoma theileri]|uniref:Uncharacterized protein n=1 Tax=Trypanosoma theileri TaxID=67003 RepID=A0A1X0P929_9TRYP|nr:uncharacterized protein TM35_000013090 [Trypanosoma theileri]ORC93432.1 hypothetical protein TM35_000013090 [Trypanosoma theileri]
MTHLSVYGGLFSDPPLISTDADPKLTDPYNKMDTIPSRYLGKGMTIGRGATGAGPEVFFDKKFLTLASQEQNGGKDVGPFEDLETRSRQEALESKKKNISTKEFLPPSFPKHSDGPGSYAGCFQNRPYEFIMPGEEDDKKKRRHRKKNADESAEGDKRKTALPNVKTNPGKKGTYGFPGVLLNNPKYDDNWRQEYERWEAAKAKAEKKAAPPKEMGGPFKVPGVTHDYLDELPGTGVSGVYHFEPVEEKPSKRKRRAKAAAADVPVFEQEKPMTFIWSRSGNEGCFDPFPNTWIDPDAMEAAKNKGKKKRKNRKQNAEYVPGPPKGATGIWKPNSFPDTTVVQSCLRRFY